MPLRGWGTWRRDNGLRGRSAPVRKPRNEKNNPINSPEFIEGTEVGDVEGHSLQGRRCRLRFRGSGRDGRRAFPQGVGARKGRTWDDGNPQGCNGKNAETDPRRKGGIGEMQGPGLRPGPLPADVPGKRPVTDPAGRSYTRLPSIAPGGCTACQEVESFLVRPEKLRRFFAAFRSMHGGPFGL